MPAVTAAQMREVDRLAVEGYGIQLVQMMELAGRALAEAGRALLGGSVAHERLVVAVGRGNNGGGGLAVSRHLANWGGDVLVVVERAGAVAGLRAQQLAAARAAGVTILEGVPALESISSARPLLFIDALIGYGLAGKPRGWTGEIIARAVAERLRTLSLDVPSGIDATTVECYEPCVRADATLTLALPKTGLLAPAARGAVGTLYLADIGIPPRLYERLGLTVGPIFERGGIVRLDDDGCIRARPVQRS